MDGLTDVQFPGKDNIHLTAMILALALRIKKEKPELGFVCFNSYLPHVAIGDESLQYLLKS